MRGYFHYIVAMSCLAAAPGFLGTARAQDAAARGAGNHALKEIVVSATKRKENLQTVPISVTAISGRAIERLHAVNLTDISSMVPNVELQGWGSFPTQALFAIRGIADTSVEPMYDPPVAVFVNGVYMPRIQGAILNTYDLQSIQILRGPQDQLFGQNSFAGAIVMRTRRPSEKFGGYVHLTYQNYNERTVKAAVNIPLMPGKLALRVAGLFDRGDGYFTNTLNGLSLGGPNVYAIRPTLLFTPTDNIDSTLIATFESNHTPTPPAVNGSRPDQLWSLLGFPSQFCCNGHTGKSIFRLPYPSNPNGTSDVYGVTSETNFHEQAGKVTMLFSYNHLRDITRTESDGLAIPVFLFDRATSANTYSGELRFTSKRSERFDYLYGLYYLHDRVGFIQAQYFNLTPPFLPINSQLWRYAVAGQTTNSEAAYASANYQLLPRLLPRLRLNGGLRLTREEKRFDKSNTPNNTSILPPQYSSHSWNDLSFALGLNYAVTANDMVYISFRQGFKSGGYDSAAATAALAGPFRPERVNAYEVGMKSEFLEHRLRVNIAAFENLYKDLQVTAEVAAPPPVDQQQLTTNAAGANIRGFEAEITARPLAPLILHANAAYLDAYYTSYPSFNPATGREGSLANNPLIFTPKWSFSGGFSYYIFEGGTIGSFTLDGDVQHQSSQYVYAPVSAATLRGANTIADFGLSWRSSSGKYQAGLFVKNAFNTIYLASSIPVAADLFTGQGGLWTFQEPSSPRRFGVTFGVNF